MMSFQVLSHEIQRNGHVTLFGRDANGDSRRATSRAFHAVWHWRRAEGRCPVQAAPRRALLAMQLYQQTTEWFTRCGFKNAEPRKDGRDGWCDTRLDRYHAHCARTGTPPSSWYDPLRGKLEPGRPARATQRVNLFL